MTLSKHIEIAQTLLKMRLRSKGMFNYKDEWLNDVVKDIIECGSDESIKLSEREARGDDVQIKEEHGK